MAFVQNLPFISILLSLFTGPLSVMIDSKKAKYVNMFMITAVGIMSALTLGFVVSTGEAYVYMMGHFPAPWGNEIRVGVLEAFMATAFCVIMLLCVIAGEKEREEEIYESKRNLYYVMINLLLCSLIALIYTNDIFNAYVFVEINTIAACGLIMIRQNGRSLVSATRYMVMSLLGSGLLLLGICFLYDLTGHLLMENIHQEVLILYSQQEYRIPLLVAIGLITVGLAVKSALYPFHTWVPDAYGHSTLSSAAVLSSLVSKGYIFLVLKIFYRVIGIHVIRDVRIVNILFVFGIIGMIMGSVGAIREKTIRRMIAYSSVAQIGYIYMGFGLGNDAGIVASVYHILCHALTKSLLFIAASGITAVSGKKKDFHSLTGAGFRNPLAGAAFTIASLSMIGFPLLSGFISKLWFAQAALDSSMGKMLPTLAALIISTVLNAIYFMKTVIRIYTPAPEMEAERGYIRIKPGEYLKKDIALVVLVILNFVFGIFSSPIIKLIEDGLHMFG